MRVNNAKRNLSVCFFSSLDDCILNDVLPFPDKSRVGWFAVLGFNATLMAKVISWQSVTHMCFLAFSHQLLIQLFFPKPPTTFLTCFCRGERRKYAGKKFRFNQGLNSQPLGHESDPERDNFRKL